MPLSRYFLSAHRGSASGWVAGMLGPTQTWPAGSSGLAGERDVRETVILRNMQVSRGAARKDEFTGLWERRVEGRLRQMCWRGRAGEEKTGVPGEGTASVNALW